MAAVRSLGLHKPAALTYLIQEGILPENCSQDAYTWETFEDNGNVDELISTSTHVVWSGGSNVYRVFSFNIEKEAVQQALFAWFPGGSSAERLANVAARDKQSTHEPLERALVVVLESQAHIFFLSGARSIISLPCEVERTFPLSQGLLFQRKQPAISNPTKQQLPPKTPLNSFVGSQSFSTSPFAAPAHQPASFVEGLFKSIISGHQSQAKASAPFHYHLPNPINEPCVVACEDKKVRHGDDNNGLLSRQERLIYVSNRDEAIVKRQTANYDPLQLAVTVNTSKGSLSIWQLSKPSTQTYWKPNRRATSYDADRKKRRRSSQPGTGAVTPNPRHSVNPRDSIGGFQEPLSKRDQVRDDGDLAAKLDPAFQNPRATGQSSRRISSMLARSELPASDTFGDGASIVPRRGASLSGANRSFRNQGKRDLRMSLRSEAERFDGEMSEDDGEDHVPSTRERLEELFPSSKGQLVGLQITHLYTVDFDDSIIDAIRVFMISSSREDDLYEGLTACIINRSGQTLHLVDTRATFGQDGWVVKWSNTRRAADITDACLFRGTLGNKLAILSKSQDGSFEVTLQAPHTVPFKSVVPPKLLINFPYSLQTAASPTLQRATGPRRIVDDVPFPLRTVVPGAGNGQLVLTDANGSQHLIKIATEPQNDFVNTCIAICETVWKPPKDQRQKFLDGWWEVKQYLTRQKDTHSDQEWTAFVVLIFSLCCSPEHASPQTPVRTRRKGGGLLRSSSGAMVDLDSYYTAIALETGGAASQPYWLTSPSWQWASEEQTGRKSMDGLGLGIATISSKGGSEPLVKKSSFIVDCVQLGREFAASPAGKQVLAVLKVDSEAKSDRTSMTGILLIALHLYREELKLNRLAAHDVRRLCPMLAQLGGWLGWSSWSWTSSSEYSTEDIDMQMWCFDEWSAPPQPDFIAPQVPSILRWVTECSEQPPGGSVGRFARLSDYINTNQTTETEFGKHLPRTACIQSLLSNRTGDHRDMFARIRASHLDHGFMECLPEGVAVMLRSIISSQQSDPSVGAAHSMFELLDRPDMAAMEDPSTQIQGHAKTSTNRQGHASVRDIHSVCKLADDLDTSNFSKTDVTAEIDRGAITRLIFKDDHRIIEARKLLHPLEPPTVRCVREPEWSEQDLLEAEQELAKVVAIRTLSVSAGRGLMQYGSRTPLLTERFPTHGFTLSCVMKPSNNNVTAEKETFTEEKVSWAFFHAGAEAGLSVARGSKGIDTSWIVYTKPAELNNRHAGFLLALGLNGHLKNIAKWVAFNYLTPKHTMTSIGLLLGMAAAYIGTMDGLVTRILSVHVTRMLPPNAAELNLSSPIQTTGIMGLGLLYCETQHRRMSEVMLSEMENAEEEDSESPLDTLRDEGYRLAAGFALGFINLGHGRNMRGLRDMHIVERLLSLAVSTKRVDLMHILDKGTAAATIAIALMFMKTEDEALARKVDIPDTPQQFEYIRPDLFLLRTMARHLIMWSKIQPTAAWVRKQLPQTFEEKHTLRTILTLDIKDLPLYNTVAGLCLAIGLRFAGTANTDACKVLLTYLDQFMRLARLPSLTYDHRLTRTTVRNCQDVIALAAAAVMAGTGDIEVFRRLRSLHGRTDADTTYGSHLAAHQAIGIIFLAGGTHTFKTTNLAVAALLCSFYPLFPATVLDNKGHLQAFRHMWVLAVEPRCLVVRDVDSHRPISMPVQIKLKTGEMMSATAPCLLPPLTTVANLSLNDPNYWRLTLDFNRPAHIQAFERHQSVFASRKRVEDTSERPFITAMQAFGQDAQDGSESNEGFSWIFDLPSLSGLSLSDRATTLPTNTSMNNHTSTRTTAVDDRLVLKAALAGNSASELWNLRILFAWAEHEAANVAKLGWLEREVIGGLKAELGIVIAKMEGNTE